MRSTLLLPLAAAAILLSGCIVQNETFYTDSIGYTHVVGEVRNLTDGWADFVQVNGAFFDASGRVIASDFTYVCTRMLPPQGSAPFDMALGPDLPPIASYEFKVEAEPIRVVLPATFALSGINVQPPDIIGYTHVLGMVENTGSTSLEFVQICAAFYDGSGRVVRTGFTYTRPSDLPPGGRASFEIAEELPPEAASVRLWVYGDEVGTLNQTMYLTAGPIALR